MDSGHTLRRNNEIERVCDDTELAWIGAERTNDTDRNRRREQRKTFRPREKYNHSQMKARLEVLRAVEESEAFMGDKLAERIRICEFAALDSRKLDKMDSSPRQKGAGVSTSNSPVRDE